VSAANRLIALDGIVDAATKTRRRDMPGRYLAAGRVVTALVAVAQGLAAVAEAIGEADEHARRAGGRARPLNDEALRVRLELAWEAGHNVGVGEHVESVWVDPQFGKAETVARLTQGADS
jgi:hypothetical protein